MKGYRNVIDCDCAHCENHVHTLKKDAGRNVLPDGRLGSPCDYYVITCTLDNKIKGYVFHPPYEEITPGFCPMPSEPTFIENLIKIFKSFF